MSLKEKIKKIKILALDVDGVLTDGRIVLDSDGKETKFFNVQDGFGLVLAREAGLKTAIITARSSAVVALRAKDLKIDQVYQDAYPKLLAYEKMLKAFKVADAQICFMGDDLPDLQVIKRAGLGVAVSNATRIIKENADYVTKAAGGFGAVREVVELILKTQGQWLSLVRRLS